MIKAFLAASLSLDFVKTDKKIRTRPTPSQMKRTNKLLDNCHEEDKQVQISKILMHILVIMHVADRVHMN
jgi:hypothetical protein